MASRSCIRPVLMRKTWTRARDSCKTVGADLLINHSKEKEKLIYEDKRSYVNFEFWIGLNDRSHEGDFNWLDKRKKITGVPWKNNKTGRYNKGKNCVVIVRKRNQDAHFLDQSCFKKAYYMCEYYTTCANQTYGANCSKKCSTNCRGPNSDCEDVNGFCIFGCDDGYQGVKCEQACDSKKFGANCSKTCSEMCGGPNKTCNNVNGFCTLGCIDGYQGHRCQDPCDSKKFGANCSKTCSEMCGGPNKTCNNVNGFCTLGCIDGYQGHRCQDPCEDNTFGADCSETCSKTCAGPKKLCNHVNGSCIFGCDDGYQGERCENFLHSKLEKHFLYSWMAIIASSIFVLGVLTCSIMSLAIQHSHKKPRSKSTFDRNGTMFRDSYPHESSLVNETAGSLSHEEHSNFHVRFESHEKDSNVPARSVLIRNHSNLSAASRSVEEFYEPETETFDDSFPADSAIKDFDSVK
ncbi:hypothetical protein RRG08_053115 [Elysia crispata]|uniref:C-type lectin domain-containing protein n=1 Tax=Elysia crispata TaxID=231223 RepID=A0AAE1DCZ4_9GAST|nr:hypothetical protein RRG08_053115 [Elysia crispata]